MLLIMISTLIMRRLVLATSGRPHTPRPGGAARLRIEGAGVVDDGEVEAPQARVASPQQARLRGADAGRMAADDHLP